MDPDEQDVLSAQDATEDEPTAQSDDSPVETPASSPDTTYEAREREWRARDAQRGRELAETRRQAAEAQQAYMRQQQELAQMRQQMGQMSQYLTTQQQRAQQDRQRQQDAYLASLPFEDRLVEQNKMVAAEVQQLRQQIAGAQQRQPMRSEPTRPHEPTQAEREAYQRERSAEILQAINTEYGTELTGQEAGIDWRSPETFEATVRTYAVLASSADDDEEPVVAKRAPKDDVDARIEAAVSKAIGVGRPNGATGRGPAGIPSEADLQSIVLSADSRQGRRQVQAQLREAVDRASKGVAVRVKNLPPE